VKFHADIGRPRNARPGRFRTALHYSGRSTTGICGCRRVFSRRQGRACYPAPGGPHREDPEVVSNRPGANQIMTIRLPRGLPFCPSRFRFVAMSLGDE
jgi:hypothetical protein